MTFQFFSALRRSASQNPHLRLIAATLFAASGTTFAADTEFIGPEQIDEFSAYPWSDSGNWSNGVPGANDKAIIPARLDENNEPVSSWGPFIDVNVTINSLDLTANTEIRNSTSGPGKNLFVSGSSTISGFLANAGGTYQLGNLSNYSAATKTITGGNGYLVDDQDSVAPAILAFKGADIVINDSGFNLFGSNAVVRDQNTGLNAFRNLSQNNGFLTIDGGYQLVTQGNLTNGPNGSITLGLNYSTRTPVVNVTGNFTNNGTVTLYSNTTFLVAGGYSGSGSIQVLGSPVNLNVVGTYTMNGGTFNLGGSGVDSFTLITTAIAVNSGAVISGNGTIQGSISVNSGSLSPGNSAGAIAVKGNLTLGVNAVIDLEIGGTSHDRILQSVGPGGTVLGGTLSLKTIADFDEEVLDESTYEILTSDMPLSGSFTNAANGARLDTADGSGSFQVNYGPSSAAPGKVILSNYIADNVPETYAQWAASLAPGVNGGGDDADGDGIKNLEAYYRGFPATPGPRYAKPTTVTVEEGSLKLTIRSPKTVTGVDVSSIVTGDFIITNAGPAPVLVDETPTMKIYQVIIPAFQPSRFVILKLELPD